MSPVREINSLSKLDKEYINKVDGTSTGALLPGEANPTHAQTMEFSSGISSVQALCQWIQIGYIDSYKNTTLGFDKYMIRNCEKSYASFMLTLVSTRQSSVPGYSGPARSGRIQLIERSFGMLVFRRVGV